MATLIQRFDIALEGNQLSVRLPEQVGNLLVIKNTIEGLVKNPPTSLGDFSRVLNELRLPDLVGSDFATSLGSLQGAVPTELSSVTGELVNKLAELKITISTRLVATIDDALAAIRAIHRLGTVDFSCLQQPKTGSSGAVGGPGPAPAGGAGPSAGSTPTGTSPASGSQPSSIEAASDQVKFINDRLGGLPAPFNVESFLPWLDNLLAFRHKPGILPNTIPIVDDILDPLNTLTAWHSSSPTQIREHMVQSVDSLLQLVRSTVPGLMGAMVADLAASSTRLDAARLRQVAEGLTARLAELKTAINSGNIGGTAGAVDEINSLLDAYESLSLSMRNGLLPTLPALNSRLSALPENLKDEMAHLVSVLLPNPALGEVANALPELRKNPAIAKEIEKQFEPLMKWMQAFTDLLDVKAVQEPLQTVAENARNAVDGLEDGLAQATAQVRAVFAELESLVDHLDTKAQVDRIEAGIGAFKIELVKRIETLFAPVRDAISQVIKGADKQIDAFSPDDVVEALRAAMTNLAAVFTDPDVVSAMDTIRNTVDSVRIQIDGLSFAPLTDEIIAGISEIAEALGSIDPSKLNPALEVALQAALAILPNDLQIMTDPLVGEFDGMVESGPVVLLEGVKAKSDEVLGKVHSFKPAALIGDQLSKPYNDLLAAMEAFKPSSLLAPADDEVAKLKQRMIAQADPGKLIEPLEEPFSQLTASLDRFKPGDLVKPLGDAISKTIDEILAVLPGDEIASQIDSALGVIKGVVGFCRAIVDMLNKTNLILSGLADSETQFSDLLESILEKIDSISDLAPLESKLRQLSAALDETKASALATAFQNAVTPLLGALETLNPGGLHAGLIRAYSDVSRSALEALPASAKKAAIAAALNRFDPLDPEFGRPYQSLAVYRKNLADAKAALAASLADWDSRYHSVDGTMAHFRLTDVTTAQLREWVREEVRRSFLELLKAVLARVEVLALPFSATFAQITTLVNLLESKIEDLLLGPNSLEGIRDSVNDLLKCLRDFNLNFLTESLDGVFNKVRDKVNSVNPAKFKKILSDSFNGMLDEIDLSLIIPREDVKTLDDDFGALIAKLKKLDPKALVTDIVQPEYERTIIPLVDAFDISALLQAIIERLRSLDAELKVELKRVNDAFREMKGSVPMAGASVSISL